MWKDHWKALQSHRKRKIRSTITRSFLSYFLLFYWVLSPAISALLSSLRASSSVLGRVAPESSTRYWRSESNFNFVKALFDKTITWSNKVSNDKIYWYSLSLETFWFYFQLLKKTLYITFRGGRFSPAYKTQSATQITNLKLVVSSALSSKGGLTNLFKGFW